ncbi:MAG TPA: DUF3160 domain-containing protein [Anaerolineaceae bacterium]|nr:DUF3160 domain-containing protein [Anaerolineaceae bacterium]
MRKNRFQNLLIICWMAALLFSCTITIAPEPTKVVQPPEATEPSIEPTVSEPAETEVETETPGDVVALPADEVYAAEFASFQQAEVSLPQNFLGGYSLPIALDAVENLDEMELSQAQLELLSQNGFVVQAPDNSPSRMLSEFYQGYERMRYGDTPAFITTDSVFHVYHLVFDKMLRDLEREMFIPMLKELTTSMIEASKAQYNELVGTPLEEAALRNLAYFSVAGVLLQTGNIYVEVQPLVEAELALIQATSGVEFSPIFNYEGQPPDMNYLEDYSQYIPRGHYTLGPELEMYFRAMMWYGRMNYRLKDPMEVQRALLITKALRETTTPSGNSALTLWQNIYDPTVFIVGKADDLGVHEFGVISDAVFGANADLTLFGDEALLTSFIETARQLPPPQVNSMWVWVWQDQDDVTQGFRFMGQRFTLDQYVFGQVMWRKVGTMSEPRDLPKALDFFAAQGSELALELLHEMGEGEYLNYDTQMAKVTAEVATLESDSWTQNLYWSWLYALQPIFEPKGEAYPAFMQTDAWARKDLHTALSSWTELKHDTILYAKQVMAEMGGGPDDPPPHGYVEPNPEAYARLLALAQMTYDGLQTRGLLGQNTMVNLNNLIDELQFLLDISLRHLTGETITEDDYWRIKYYGGWLEAMTVAAADPAGDGYAARLEDQKSALVADVATGIERVLEEGVGYPTYIYVVLPDEPYRVGIGVVYTYYEFIVEPSERMTDETWQALLESGQAPAQPEWTQAFISE